MKTTGCRNTIWLPAKLQTLHHPNGSIRKQLTTFKQESDYYHHLE